MAADDENNPIDDYRGLSREQFTLPQRVWLLEQGHSEMRREFETFQTTVLSRFEQLDERGRSNSRWAIGILCSILLIVVPLLLSVLGQT